MQIGILGGTFDPIHFGHLIAAEHVRDQLELHQVWFLPAFVPPHKHGKTVSRATHRLNMVERAVANHPQFRVSKVEFEREGNSYTVDTMTILRERFPQHEFFFIIGADMVQDLPRWHRIDQLINMVQFVGLDRPGYERPELANNIARRVRFVTMPLVDITSTNIRKRRASGRSVRYLVPDSVREYMEEHRLYET